VFIFVCHSFIHHINTTNTTNTNTMASSTPLTAGLPCHSPSSSPSGTAAGTAAGAQRRSSSGAGAGAGTAQRRSSSGAPLPQMSMWILSFSNGRFQGSLTVLAPSVQSARQKMQVAWEQESKKEGSVYDSTFDYTPTVSELRKTDNDLLLRMETKEFLERQQENKLEYEDFPLYSCRMRIQTEDGPKFTHKKFFTLDEVIRFGWIAHVSQGVVLSLALDG